LLHLPHINIHSEFLEEEEEEKRRKEKVKSQK
jgi:hypothetical protein